MNDPNWKFPNQYANPENIFEGEIGKIEGVRFIESTEAKVFEPLHTLTLVTDSISQNYINFSCPDEIKMSELVGKWVIVGSNRYYIAANTPTSLQLYKDSVSNENAIVNAKAGDVVYIGDCGKNGCKIYATLVFGDNAYGTTSIEGEGLKHIVKQLGSYGANDPLNQRATVGWKANKVSMRLCEAFMVRIETTSSAND